MAEFQATVGVELLVACVLRSQSSRDLSFEHAVDVALVIRFGRKYTCRWCTSIVDWASADGVNQHLQRSKLPSILHDRFVLQSKLTVQFYRISNSVSRSKTSYYRPRSREDNTSGSVRVCACVSVRLSVGALLFEPFDLWPWFSA